MIRGRVTASLVVALLAVGASVDAAPPPKVTDGVPTPGKSIAGSDDASALSINPANLAFLPEPELRWTWVWTQNAAPLPIRGHSLEAGLPFWFLALGGRVDLMDPPEAAPVPFDVPYQVIRGGLAGRIGRVASFGTTVAWTNSDSPAMDEGLSLTSGLTLRPFTYLSVAAVARDWNLPTLENGTHIDRSWDFGLAVRPVLGMRALELGGEIEYHEQAEDFVPRFTLGVDVPRLGRLRGEVSILDTLGSNGAEPRVAALAGLDINFGTMQASGGAVFGDAITRSGTGFYAGAAIRAYREPGVRLPSHVARVNIDNTPGDRGHVALLRRLWRLADDPEIHGVLLVMRDEPASSLAHSEEVADALRLLRDRGKKVVCHLEDAGAKALYVCSHADRTAMNPAGGLRFAGLSSRYLYFNGLLEKLGVQADFVRIGPHKGAAEQLALSAPTDVAREDHQELVDQYQRMFLAAVGKARKIPPKELEKRIAKGPFLAHEARAAGLIDTLAYEDEVNRVVEEVMGGSSRVVVDDPMANAPEKWGRPDKVAIVYLSGDMVDGESQTIPFIGIRLAGSRTIGGALQAAREDPTVKAVVLRVETGGGSSLAADVILRQAILTAREKPLIVSMGTAAASGGYYASVAGHPILANRSTLTGSIGIFYGKVDVSRLLASLGIGVELVRSSPRADAESFFRPFTDDERRELGVKVKQFYDLFVARVSEGRDMPAAEIDAVARGRVWTGQQAVDKKLVDRIGGMREALIEARSRGGLPANAPIIELPEEDDSLLGLVLDLLGINLKAEVQSVLPASILDLARALAPFVVYDSTRPLARVDLFEGLDLARPIEAAVPKSGDDE